MNSRRVWDPLGSAYTTLLLCVSLSCGPHHRCTQVSLTIVLLTLRFQLPQSDGKIAITTQTTVSRIHPVFPSNIHNSVYLIKTNKSFNNRVSDTNNVSLELKCYV